MTGARGWVLALSLVAASTLPGRDAAAAGAATPDPFAGCRQQFALRPHDYESAYCFYQAALRLNLWEEGAKVFASLMREHPENFWIPLAGGHLYRDREPDRAERLYREAAEGFRKLDDADGEILARSNLRNFLFPKGRVKEAEDELRRVIAVGESVTDPLLKARVWTLEASHVQDTGGDLGLAYGLLKRTEKAIFPDGPYRLQRTCLNALGLVAFRMGRFEEARGIFEQLDQIATAARDPQSQASARYNILNVASLKESLLPTAEAGPRLMQLAARSLETGIAAQHRLVTLKTHRSIAALLAHQPGRRDEALQHVDTCLALAVSTRQPHDEAVCSWLQAALLTELAPERAHAAQRRALDATARANNPFTTAYSAGRHMQLSWATKPRAEAIRDSQAAIDSIETLRALQDDSSSRAELFSTWTLEYYWLSGRLLQDGPGDVDLAFSITERMRARSLLEAAGRPRTSLDAADPDVAARRATLSEIATIQRRLMNPDTDERTRRESLQVLGELERREQEQQRRIAVASNTDRRSSAAFADLAEVQSTLADNEALLSYQVGTWNTFEGEFGGGAWLLALTRHTRSVHRMPDRAQLAPMIPVFEGLLARGDALDRTAGARLYDDLLREALRPLPPAIDRLIIVPDGPLHGLPFEALRSSRDADPLAVRYEVVVAPSATLWRHWRQQVRPISARGALVFADPALTLTAGGKSLPRDAEFRDGVRLGPLPHARSESRALARYIGSVDALTGPLASEAALKARDLGRYAVLHVAAHAIADDVHPERSAIVLAPGSDAEDGLLQAREIDALDLHGRVVVLSACQTASGMILNGEGVLSLARSFFAAGAGTVIGTRWPIRDEDAAALFDDFYRVLASGASISDALAQSKRAAIAAGRPAASWASLVLLGDGAFRPTMRVVPASPDASLRAPATTLLAGLFLAMTIAATVRRHRTTSRS